MAIYHLTCKPVSRGAGRSATAAAAYRAGECIEDERTGQQYDYTKKRGVLSTDIVMPAGSTWRPSRSELWNVAELAERRKDACVAREFEGALPAELSAQERHHLALDFARWMADREGCAVDVCLHAPGRGGDNRNYHAHLLRTTREIAPDGLGRKLASERAGRDRKADLKEIRAKWAAMVNAALQRAGKDARVDHRSLRDQGIDREPTRHLGPSAAGYERRTGEPSRKRLDWAAEAASRLDRARETGESERRAMALDRAILDTSVDLAQARAERDQRQAEQYAAAIARGLSPKARRAILEVGRVHVLDRPDGTHWLLVRQPDGTSLGVARGRAEDRHLAERVAAALPAAVLEVARTAEAAQAQQRQHDETHATQNERQERERSAGSTRSGTAGEQDRVRGERRPESPPTPVELAEARAALVEYARRRRITTDTPADIRTAANGLRDEWMAAGAGTQRRYMALRQIRREAERAARQRLRRTGRNGTAAEGNGIGGARCTRGYQSAETAAARAAGLRYEWDKVAWCRRYHDREGREVFTSTRTRIEMMRHDADAEIAALRVAGAKWGRRVQISGSSVFRERMARLAAREGIAVEDQDLQEIVRAEHARVQGKPPLPTASAESELGEAQRVCQTLISNMVQSGEYTCSDAQWTRACSGDLEAVRAECRSWAEAALSEGWPVAQEALEIAGLDSDQRGARRSPAAELDQGR